MTITCYSMPTFSLYLLEVNSLEFQVRFHEAINELEPPIALPWEDHAEDELAFEDYTEEDEDFEHWLNPPYSHGRR